MNCLNCGESNREQAVFCRRCGSKLGEMPASNSNWNNKKNTTKNTKKKKSKVGIVLFLILLLCAIGGSVFYFVNRQIKEKEYQNEVAKGDKYFQEMDYVKAEATYLELISINPKKEKAYMQLADVYVAQDKYDEAIEILTQGATQTKSSDIEEKLEALTKEIEENGPEVRKKKYEAFLKNNLIPLYGIAVEDEMIFSYKYGSSDGIQSGANMLSMKEGIRSVAYADLTGDGLDEMIVVRASKVTEDKRSAIQGMISIQVYEMQEEIVELPMGTRKMNYPIYQNLNKGDLYIFTKKLGETTCIGMAMNMRQESNLPVNERNYTEFYTVKDGTVVCTKAIMLEDMEVLDLTDCADNIENSGRNPGEGTLIKSVTPDEYDASGVIILLAAYVEELCNYIGETEWYNTQRSDVEYGNPEVIGVIFSSAFWEKFEDVQNILKIEMKERMEEPNNLQIFMHQDATGWKAFVDSIGVKTEEENVAIDLVNGPNGTKQMEAYQKIIDEYNAAVAAGIEYVYDNEEEFPNVDPDVIRDTISSNGNVPLSYVFYDFNEDGSNELVIAWTELAWVGEAGDVVGVYSYVGNAVVRLFEDRELGYRAYPIIYRDGTIYIYWSGGASWGTANFFRLNEDGSKVDLIERYTADWELYPDTPYFLDSDTKVEFLSEAEMELKQATHGNVVILPCKDISIPIM